MKNLNIIKESLISPEVKLCFPFWYWPLIIVFLLALLIFIFLKVRLFIERKKKIQEVKERLKNETPFSEFLSQLNLLARQINSEKSKNIIQKLDTNFRLFLENEFFIFTLNKEPKKIASQLKKYYPFIFKKCNILGFFQEIEKLSVEKTGSKEYEQMLDMARELATSCVEQQEQK